MKLVPEDSWEATLYELYQCRIKYGKEAKGIFMYSNWSSSLHQMENLKIMWDASIKMFGLGYK